MQLRQEKLTEMCEYYIKKIDNGLFSVEDVDDFLKVYFSENSTLAKNELDSRLDKIKNTIATYYGCNENQIATSDIDFSEMNVERVPYCVIFGNANFYGSMASDLGDLQLVGKSVILEKSNIEDLKNLMYVGKNVHFINSKVINLGSLQYVGGNAFFNCNSPLEELYLNNFDKEGNKIEPGKALCLAKTK